MYKYRCEGCKKVKTSKLKWQKCCSNECRKTHYNNISGRSATVLIGLPTATVGAVSEMAVAMDLLKNGHAVFRALSGSCFCDLVSYKDSKIYKIEVRTGFINKSSENLSFPRNISPDADTFAIYERNSGKISYFEKDGYTEIKLY